MNGESLTPQQEKLDALKKVLPEVFAEGKIDWEKLKATLGEDINFANERYVLNWAGKSEAFKVLQTPTTKTLAPAKKESVNFDETEHIFIEGENLEVLKVLQKSYFGKVKMIYIDPPYNTGNDSFIYPDKFSETKDEYQKRVGDKDEEGYLTKDGMFHKNSKEGGQYHSNWLNMMYSRIFLAKNLLKDNGVIFISIGPDEVANLILVCNEIFGEENKIGICIRQAKTGGNTGKHFSPNIEYILVYARNIVNVDGFKISMSKELIKKVYTNIEPDGKRKGEKYRTMGLYQASLKDLRPNQKYFIECPDGERVLPPCSIQDETMRIGDGRWRWTKSTFYAELKKGNVLFKKTNNGVLLNSDGEKSNWNIYTKIWLKDRQEEGQVPNDLILGFENRHSSKELQELNIPFDFAKPTGLITYLIKLAGIEDNDIVLDFFAGSATTAHSIMLFNKKHNKNVKYLCIQLPELCDQKGKAFEQGFQTISDIGKERIRRSGKNIYEKSQSEIARLQADIEKLDDEIQLDETKEKTAELTTKIEQLKNQDLGFKVLKLSDSNFKQWQQIKGRDKEALEEQMKLFIDPVAEHATIENMVYELLLKSGKDLNSTIALKEGFYVINDNELIFLLEKANQSILDAILTLKPKKVIALDKLFKGNDQLKTNASLQMKDAGIEFKTI